MSAAVFVGRTNHVRHAPKRHAFSYRLFSLLLDIDRIEETAAKSRLFRHNRFGVVSFHDRDHGDGRAPLREWAEEKVAAAGAPRPARLELLSFPRIFGYVFNPLSLWFCRDGAGRLETVIYEVHNTFGERHAYVARTTGAEDAVHRHQAEKSFHVSPFFAVDGRYRFRLRAPGDVLRLGIDYVADRGPLFFAGWNAGRREFSDRVLMSMIATHPWVTAKAIAAIHWEALFIWGKSAGYHKKPDPPAHAATIASPE